MERLADGPWLWHDESRGWERFHSSGLMAAFADEYGIGWQLNYGANNQVETAVATGGRQISFGWQNGKVSQVVAPNGAAFNYTYTNGNLQRVANPVGNWRDYSYDAGNPARLSGISIRNVRYSAYTYYNDNRVASSGLTSNGGNAADTEKLNFGYLPDTTIITNARGAETRMIYADVLGSRKIARIEQSGVTDCPNSAAYTYYDANGYIDYTIDFRGNRKDYSYNAKGQLQEETIGINDSRPQDKLKTVYSWDSAANRLLGISTYGGPSLSPVSETTYVYYISGPATGRLQSKTVTNRSSIGIYGAALTTTWAYSFHGNGMLHQVTMDGPVVGGADAVTQTFSSAGDLLSISNGVGHISSFGGYNGLGLATTATNENGHVEYVEYDALGRIGRTWSTHSGSNNSTYYYYGDFNQLTNVTYPDGSIFYYYHDAIGRLTSTRSNTPDYDQEDSDNTDIINYSYDNAVGKLSAIQKKRAKLIFYCTEDYWYSQCPPQYRSYYGEETTTFSENYYYDSLGRLKTVSGANGQSQSLSYDVGGNVISTRNALNQTTTVAYDSLNRKIQQTDPDGAVTQFGYDEGGRLASVRDARNLLTTYAYDGIGRLYQLSSPDTGTTTYSYNTSGLLSQMTLAGGVVTTYGYDALGRPSSRNSPDADAAWEYDGCTNGIGRLCAAHDSNGMVAYAYSPGGLIVHQHSGIASVGYDIGFGYDAMNRLTSMTYPGNVTVYYGYDKENRLSKASISINGIGHWLVSDTRYKPFGGVETRSLGNGVWEDYQYDQSERVTGKGLSHGLQSWGLAYNEANEIVQLNRGVFGPSYQLGYDAMSRLTSANSANDANVWAYDATGNREAATFNGGVSDYVPEGGSNRLTQITFASNPTQPIDYIDDARGNRVMTHHHAQYLYDYSYTGINQLKRAHRRNAPVETIDYQHNALGKRVRTLGGGQDIRYSYSPGGQLLTESGNGVGSVKDHHIWFGGEQIAMVRNGQLFFVQTDQVGRPELLTNTAAQPVWKAYNAPFGRSVLQDSIGGFNLGLPGQYQDSTGLWQNWHRVYDASTGRYLQSDPIGLLGGINTYSYVGGNPVSRIDHLGLDWMYSQSTGQLSHNGSYVATGYAGNGAGLNNPAMQNVQNVGPLPQGSYTIGPQYNSANTGPGTMALNPAAANNMFGRSQFRIHGDNSQGNQSASQGCMIFGPSVRNQIANSGDNVLQVGP